MDVYKPSLVRNYANRPNCWTRSRIDVPQIDQGEIFSMKDAVSEGITSVLSALGFKSRFTFDANPFYF